MLKLASLLGLVVFLALAWAMSERRRLFPWRAVLWGLGLQASFAVLILKTETGRHVFEFANRVVAGLVRFAGEGSEFVFGPLALDASLARVFPERPLVLAILLTSTIILMASLSSLLYHWGVLQRVVRGIAWVMRKAMGTSGSETLAAAANIFMGQTEAPLLVKPYIPRMTRSELLCMMTGGMATIAGGVAAIYAKMGADVGHPDMAGHLLTASVMNAPAALLIAKVMLPETEPSETAGAALASPPRTTTNSVDALCRGASEGIMLAINVVAMLIAFVAVVALANHLLILPQTLFASWRGGFPESFTPVTLQAIVGWLNAPFAWLMGVPWNDCLTIGRVLGERIVLNEFFGYLTLTSEAGSLAPRSFVLATYALCGFANFASVAIQVGGIGSLAPERRGDMAKFGIRAMIGGLLAAYVTTCVVGVLT